MALTAADLRITDVHVHVQPWHNLNRDVSRVMRNAQDDFDYILEMMYDPKLLLEFMDREGVYRVGMVSYPAQDVMGVGMETNEHTLKYAQANPERLLPYGGVNARFTTNAVRDVEELVDKGMRVLKIHPPHQRYPANAYREGLSALADIYATLERLGVPVLIHTGTSIFPGARCNYGNPLELDDVALDFPDLQIIMGHGGRPFHMGEAFFILRRHKNVWFDMSGVPPKSLLDYYPKLAELEKQLLWGTDWPSPGVKTMRKNIDQFLSLPLSDSLKRAAMETNPERLIPTRK
jgi:predicted TIM-barrel fold metal-dependent hydrolase